MLSRFWEVVGLVCVRCVGEIGVGGGAEGMNSVSPIPALEGLVRWMLKGDEGEDGVEEVGVKASSSQESGGGAGVNVGFKESDLRFEGRSVTGEQMLLGFLVWIRLWAMSRRRRTGVGAGGKMERGICT